jgi:hypothetical protein
MKITFELTEVRMQLLRDALHRAKSAAQTRWAVERANDNRPAHLRSHKSDIRDLDVMLTQVEEAIAEELHAKDEARNEAEA